MKTLIKVFLPIILVIMLLSCDRERSNPYDSGTESNFWAPSNLTASQGGKAPNVILSWKQEVTHIDGIKIERKTGTTKWLVIATLPKTATTWTDSNVTALTLYDYQVYAYAGLNKSTPVTISFTPRVTIILP